MTIMLALLGFLLTCIVGLLAYIAKELKAFNFTMGGFKARQDNHGERLDKLEGLFLGLTLNPNSKGA